MKAKLPTALVDPRRAYLPPTPKPFQKGQEAWNKKPPPNPKGNPSSLSPRPKGYELNLRRACRELTPEILEHLKAKLPEPRDGVIAASLLLAYGWGRPTQQINARVITSAGDLTDEELRAIIDGGQAQGQIGDDP